MVVPLILLCALAGAAAPAVSPCGSAETCLALAGSRVSLLPEGREEMRRCVDVLTPVADRWPEDWRIRWRLAQCHMSLGQFEQAMKVAGACTTAHPGSYECLYSFAFSTKQAKGEEAAADLYERLAAMEIAQGRRTTALPWLVSGALKNEDVGAARRWLELALQNATSTEERAGLATRRASLAILEHDKVLALRSADEAVALCPKRADVAVSRVFVLLVVGELDAARKAILALPMGEASTFDIECVQWADRVLSRTALRGDLAAWSARHNHHRSFLLRALEAHLAGDDQVACTVLNDGHAFAGKPFLHPFWLKGCEMPSCRLSKVTP